jgi:myo-inositol-1(or 4)-monophosphatase
MTTAELEKITRQVMALSHETGNWMAAQTDIHESMAEIKTENNLVTYVDKESERRFAEGLRKIVPEAGFVAEEGTGEANKGGLNWVIDPLDGTTNYVHGVKVWCTSIGLCLDHNPIVGVIYDPNTEEMFSAWQGGGAWLNNKRIHTSSISNLGSALLATGFPYDDFGREEQYISLFREFMRHTRGMRRLGSAALDMAWTAAGRFEAFYEYGLNPWDIAAGTILVREAGGLVTQFDGGDDPVFGDDMVCSNGNIHLELIEVIQKFFK